MLVLLEKALSKQFNFVFGWRKIEKKEEDNKTNWEGLADIEMQNFQFSFLWVCAAYICAYERRWI